MARGRSAAEMADMQATRGPYSDPRDGRLAKIVVQALDLANNRRFEAM